MLEKTTGHPSEILGEAWSSFWEVFVGDICAPSAANAQIQLPVSLQKSSSYVAALRSPWRETGHALAMHPRDLLTERRYIDTGYVRLTSGFVGRQGRGARPSSPFITELKPTPTLFPGEWFAAGIGHAFSHDGEPEFGVVLKAELAVFEAHAGSLSARGIVMLSFCGSSVLLPLFLAASIPLVSNEAENYFMKRKISQQLSVQDIRCEVTGGFHFSREDLIMKLTHRLSVQGPFGVCEIQSALTALGYAPGHIDGKAGPRYRAAAHAFASAWGLQAADIEKPVFFNFVARALTGEQPPGK